MRRRDLLIAVLAILVVWQVFAMVVNRPILPTPIEVAQVFFVELQTRHARPFLSQLVEGSSQHIARHCHSRSTWDNPWSVKANEQLAGAGCLSVISNP